MVKHLPGETRRQQLYQAALEVCAQKGYHQTRVEDIVARAGLSKGSLYHHFRGKEDLFLSLYGEMTAEFKQQMIQLFVESQSAAEALRKIIQYFKQWIHAHSDLLQAMMDFYLLGARNDHFRQIFLAYYAELAEVIANIIQQGIDRGEFSQQLDPQRLAWIYLTAGDGLLWLHMILRQMDRGVELLEELVELLLCAMASPVPLPLPRLKNPVTRKKRSDGQAKKPRGG